MQDPSLTSKPHLSVAASSDLTRHCSECRVKKGESFKVLGTSVQFSSVQLLSCVQLFATPWPIQSIEFSRSEYWSGLPFPSARDLPDPEIEFRSLALLTDSLLSEPPRKPSRVKYGG